MKKTLLYLIILTLVYSSYAQDNQWMIFKPGNSVGCFVEDEEYYWFGTQAGLVRQEKVTGMKKYYDEANSSLPVSEVSCICKVLQGNKWIGTSEGLVKFDNINWILYDTLNSNIPDNNVKIVTVDNYGNKWIGTQKGIAKFDDTEWTVFDTLNCDIPDNDIVDMLIDDDDNKWIVSDYAISRFDNESWLIYDSTNTGLPDKIITTITIDNFGNKWIGTYLGGLVKFDDVDWTVYSLGSGILDNAINIVKADTQGNIWVGTTYKGLLKFDGNSWNSYTMDNSEIPSDFVFSINFDSENNKWIGTYAGLVKFDETEWIINNTSKTDWFEGYRITKITIDEGGRKIIGSYFGEIGIFNDSSWTILNIESSALDGFGVTEVFAGRNGDLWFGMEDINGLIENVGYLVKYDGNSWAYYHDQNSGLPYNIVGKIVEDQLGNKWIGTLGGGLAKFDDTNWTVFNYENTGMTINGINDLTFDSQNNLWVCARGLFKYDENGWINYLCDEIASNYSVYSIAIDNQENKWIACSNYGLAKFDGTDWTVYNAQNTGIPLLEVVSIAAESNGSIWIGTKYGLMKFYQDEWTVYNTSNSPLTDNHVNVVIVDLQNNKWIGTDLGLCVFNENGIQLSAKNTQSSENGISIYPNPALDKVYLDTNNNYCIRTIEIFDMFGNLVKTIYYNSIAIDIADLSAGVYILKITTNEDILVKKIIKQ